MIYYICRAMKINSWNLLIALLFAPLSAFTQVESAMELMEDTLSWEFHEPHIGGASAEEAEENSLYIEKSADWSEWTLSDSIANIPAYDLYCNWDTKNLFAVKDATSQLETSKKFTLCYESCDFTYPAAGNITSSFGPRWGRMHFGLDIDLETGDNVMAAFEGMVRISQYHASYGNVVVIRHANGLETLYAHLSQRKVKPGDRVESGAIVGLGGNTGRSYGSHLHFEIRFMGEAIDPNLVVDPGKHCLRDWEFALDKKHFDYTKTAPVDPKAIAARKATTAKKYHTVKKGETLSSISRAHGTTVDVMCKLNSIKKSSKLKLGQKIRYK
jgi:murein DD-endopeptidase MepM/ murein hydrolase activator NlpD